jgi:23S rRNA (cytosine1962-C5)-methyltransferase
MRSISGAARRPVCSSTSARTARRHRHARGRLLDCFTYHGGFALKLAQTSSEAKAFDISEDAVARVRLNARRNGVDIDARVGNVFDELRGLERLGERFDTIVLDPPAFAKAKRRLRKPPPDTRRSTCVR